MRRDALVTGAALAMLLALGGCGDGTPTQLFVCYGIDPELVAPDTVVRACVRSDEGEALFGCDETSVLSLGQTGAVLSQAVVQGGAERVRISLAGEVTRPGPGGTTRTVPVEQALDVPFVPGEIIDVALRLEPSCLDRTCTDGTTCIDGACVDASVNERCLTPHGMLPREGCTDPRLVAACPAPFDE